MAQEEKKKFDPQALIDTLNHLDFENVGGWPMPVKLGAAILVLALVLFAGYMFDISDLKTNLADLDQREETLMKQYEDKAYKAKNLDQYRAQLAEMNDQFGALLQQLPKDTEVPGLLEDITHTGEGSGLEINKIDLGKEVVRQFYAELPINIAVTGDFHGFGNFTSGVAALPHIVTLHNFSIKRSGKSKLLQMTITAETYRYVGGSSASAGNAGKKKGGKKK